MKPSTVLLVHNFYRNRGGEDEHVEQLEQLLKSRGHEVVTYYKHSAIIAGSFLEKLLLLFRFLWSWQTVQNVTKLIKLKKPDMVHIHNIFPLISPSVYTTVRRHRIPIVQSIHNFRPLCLNALFLLEDGSLCEKCIGGNFVHGVVRRCYQKSWFKSLWMAMALFELRFQNQLWENVSAFFCPTDFVGHKIKAAGCLPEKVILMPYFLSEARQDGNGEAKKEKFALYIGRLSREKGVKTLVKAFSDLTSIPLKIVGKGPLENEIRTFIQNKNLTHIECLGFVNNQEKFCLLQNAACLIFPSECYETLGIVMLESFKAGTPVIASKLGSRSSVVDDGFNGKLFSSGNSDDLRRTVVALFENESTLKTMQLNAYQTFERKFSETIAYQNLIKGYSLALNCFNRQLINSTQ